MWEMSEYYSAKSQSYAFIWKASRLPSLMVSNSSWIATQCFLKQWCRFLEKSRTWENKQRPKYSSWNKHLKAGLTAAFSLTRWDISEWVTQNQKGTCEQDQFEHYFVEKQPSQHNTCWICLFSHKNYHSHLHLSAHCKSASWFSVKQKGNILWFCKAPKGQWTERADSKDHKSMYRMTVHWPDIL